MVYQQRCIQLQHLNAVVVILSLPWQCSEVNIDVELNDYTGQDSGLAMKCLMQASSFKTIGKYLLVLITWSTVTALNICKTRIFT
jgi:hypothetical protein